MDKTPLYRVRDWPQRFETHRTRELRNLTWIPESTDLSSDRYAAILDHPSGAAHYGVAVALHIVASKTTPRGDLRREDGRPHDAQSLARVTRMPVELVQEAIQRLIEIGDIEIAQQKSRGVKSSTSRNGAAISRDGAERRGKKVLEGKESSSSEGKEENRSASPERNEPTGPEPRAGQTVAPSRSSIVATPSESKAADDDDLTPEQKLCGLFEQNSEVLTGETLQRIRETLELRAIDLKAYVHALAPRLKPNEHIISATAIALDFAKRFATKTRPTRIPARAKPEAPKCPDCNGAGMVRAADGLLFAPCRCAPESYKAAWAAREAERIAHRGTPEGAA